MTTNVDMGSAVTQHFERVEVELGSFGQVMLVGLAAKEGLSTLFTLEGRARVKTDGSHGVVKPERIAGDHATVRIRDTWGSERTIRGLVAEAEVEIHDVGEATVRFTVRPDAYRLTLGSNCRSFQDKDVIEIARAVFASASLDVRFDITGTYAKRAYTVQYNENDFDFVVRLFEEEGIYYWFDHAEGSRMVVADRSQSAPDIDDAAWKAGAPSGAMIRYRAETGLESPYAFVRELGSKPRALAGKVSLGSFDFKKPSFKVEAANAGGPTAIEHYDAPGGYVEDPATLAQRARVGAERAKAYASLHQAVTPSVRAAPGRALELTGHPFGRLDSRYLVVETSFTIDNVGDQGVDGKPIDVHFVALQADLPFRPLRATPPAAHPGLQTGVVVGPAGEEIHTDEHGRIRLQQHWDREGAKDETSGRWVRVAQRGVASSMMFPRMGWNILSFGEEGSVDSPMAMSRTFDGEHPPPYSLPENKTRTAYRTATSPGGGTHNEIRFEDKKGSEEMFVNSTGDMNVLVKNIKGEIIHGFMVHKIGIDHTLEVGGVSDVQIEKDQTVSVGGNQSEKVGTDRQKLVNGNETVKIGSVRSLKTGVNVDTTGESRSLKVGAMHISATLGEVKAQSRMVNQMVGGAVIKATPRKMTEVVGSEVSADTVVGYLPASAQAAIGKLKKIPGVSALMGKLKGKAGVSVQTVGGLKMELGKDRKIEVQKTYTERVLGMMKLITAEGAFSDTAKKAFEMSTGAHQASAKTILLKSEKEVVVKCGSSSLTVNTDGIKIAAPEIQLDGAAGFAICHTQVDINP